MNAKSDMYVDENFEMYSRKEKERKRFNYETKNVINNDTLKYEKLYGLDYKTTMLLNSYDMSVDVKEVKVVRDKKTNKTLYYEEIKLL